MWRSCAARATLLLSTAHAALGAAAPKKPNIMLLLTDDQDLALGGWTPMKQADGTWVADGATAVNWFIHTPVCCPSRGELLSGRYFHNIRNPTPSGGCMHVNTSVVNPNSFGAHLAGAGYTMAWFGKHMNQCPKEPPPGWDCPTCYWFANGGGADAEPGGFFNATFNDYAGGKAVANPALYGGKTGAYTANTAGGEFAGYTTSVIANKSIAWLKQVAAGPEPFFLALAPKAPHVAATPAPWYLEGTFIATCGRRAGRRTTRPKSCWRTTTGSSRSRIPSPRRRARPSTTSSATAGGRCCRWTTRWQQ
jgi:N-acetylglucosamine-6-sulfatase